MGFVQNFRRLRDRLRTPYAQNFIIGILIGLTGGLYVALNMLGAGGGKPNSASTINTANAVLCVLYGVSAFCGGTVLNKIGPAWTAFVSLSTGDSLGAEPRFANWYLLVSSVLSGTSSTLAVSGTSTSTL